MRLPSLNEATLYTTITLTGVFVGSAAHILTHFFLDRITRLNKSEKFKSLCAVGLGTITGISVYLFISQKVAHLTHRSFLSQLIFVSVAGALLSPVLSIFEEQEAKS